jgi:hypothetical protein
MQFVLGLDLGKARDHTALVVNRKSVDWGGGIHHGIQFAHRFPLGVSYPAMIREVTALIDQLPPMPEKPALLADATGVGAPVIDLMREEGLQPHAVTLTAGSHWVRDGFGIRLPKTILASTINIGLQTGSLMIASRLPLLEVLKRELSGFKVTTTAAGNDAFGNDSQTEHDDMVIALGLAVFGAEVGMRMPRTVLI